MIYISNVYKAAGYCKEEKNGTIYLRWRGILRNVELLLHGLRVNLTACVMVVMIHHATKLGLNWYRTYATCLRWSS